MTEENSELTAAVVSDRGLSEKRPLNEDSYICDPARSLFAVADGVGGAQAGEVASQTAIEVLGEAFRHHVPDVDNEDLMEIAIQRANNSIHSMSREHPKMSRMATTIVALHLDGNLATIGHVGDSRLYRLSPGGKLFRETRDHSVVEEEVRAGRMTPEQATNHPSRNVISRALGAEEAVEVDLKTVEVVPGTAFLLCSDGITRHIPDDELRTHLIAPTSLEAICEEMKRICYERGAEDNLTAVIVRLNGATQYGNEDGDEEHTVSTARMAVTAGGPAPAAPIAPAPAPEPVQVVPSPAEPPIEPPAPAPEPAPVVAQAPVVAVAAPVKKRGFFSRLFRFLLLLILIALFVAAAFVVGLYFQKKNPDNKILTSIVPSTPTDTSPVLTGNNPPVVPEGASYDAERREVDRNPNAAAVKLAGQDPLKSTDPSRPYLYGRAMLLTGHYAEAITAFKRAGDLLAGKPGLESVKVDNALSELTAATRANDDAAKKAALDDLDRVMQQVNAPPGAPSTGPTPSGVNPGASPTPK